MSKDTAPTLQKVKDEQARLAPLADRARELREAIAREKAAVDDLIAAIKQPQEAEANQAIRALALGSAPLENIEAKDFRREERRNVLRQRCAQAEERGRILEAALRENMLEQDAVKKAVSAAKAKHFEVVCAAVFSGDAMQECRRQLVYLYAGACAAGNTTGWYDWLAAAVTDEWKVPADEEYAAAVKRFAGE
jgi:chromosome segregation ATPase